MLALRTLDFDAAVEVYSAFAELVKAEGFRRQCEQRGLLLGEHDAHLAPGGAMNACVGPVLLPAVEVGLGFFEALKTQALERRVLGVAHTALDLALAIGVAYAARQSDGTVVREHVAAERVERRVAEVRFQDTFAEVVEHDGAGNTAQAAEGLLMEFSPDTRARLEGEQTYGLAAVAERENEHPGAAVAPGVRIADHWPGAVIDLRFFAWWSDDDGAGLLRGRAVQSPDEAFDTLIGSAEGAGGGAAAGFRRRTRVGGHLVGRF